MSAFLKDMSQLFICQSSDINAMRQRVRITSYEEPGYITVTKVQNFETKTIFSIPEDQYQDLVTDTLRRWNMRRTSEARVMVLLNHMMDQGIYV